MKNYIRNYEITKDVLNYIMEIYKNDNNVDVDNPDADIEQWIGLKGTTTLKSVFVNADGEITLTDFGITVTDLRHDTKFLRVCLYDADVNHALCVAEPEDFKNNYAENLFDWYLGKTDVLPVTECGLTNYVERYLESK